MSSQYDILMAAWDDIVMAEWETLKAEWETPVWKAIETLINLLQNGSEHPQDHLEIILEFYRRCWMCWILESWDNLPVHDLLNTEIPEMVINNRSSKEMIIPADALAVFTSLRAVSFDGNDVLDIDQCMHIANTGNTLKMNLCTEGIAQVIGGVAIK